MAPPPTVVPTQAPPAARVPAPTPSPILLFPTLSPTKLPIVAQPIATATLTFVSPTASPFPPSGTNGGNSSLLVVSLIASLGGATVLGFGILLVRHHGVRNPRPFLPAGDRYRILDKIGEGGAGIVYRARDSAGTLVAMKILHPHLAQQEEYRRRFQREARLASHIDSPHVVKIIDFGQQSGRPFLAMELVQGRTLAELIGAQGPLPVRRAAEIARDISAGLAAAHVKGVVHRDIKPQNIMIDRHNVAKVMDFGIAREGTLPRSREPESCSELPNTWPRNW